MTIFSATQHYNIVPTLQRSVALKIIFANRLVIRVGLLCVTKSLPAGNSMIHKTRGQKEDKPNFVSSFRFVNALNMRATKCAICLDTLHFVRPSSRCAGMIFIY